MENKTAIERFAVWRATAETPKADVGFVPPMERRRLTGVERAALTVAWQVRSEEEIPVVFSSRWGEIGTTLKLMRQFHEDREMSPAGFSASVHNAAPGAFSLLTKNHAPYTAIAAGARSLENGLLEALVTPGAKLFVYAEEETPPLYQGDTGPSQSACAVAVRLASGGPYQVSFRTAELPPVTFDALVAFLEGRSATLAAASFLLQRIA